MPVRFINNSYYFFLVDFIRSTSSRSFNHLIPIPFTFNYYFTLYIYLDSTLLFIELHRTAQHAMVFWGCGAGGSDERMKLRWNWNFWYTFLLLCCYLKVLFSINNNFILLCIRLCSFIHSFDIIFLGRGGCCVIVLLFNIIKI